MLWSGQGGWKLAGTLSWEHQRYVLAQQGVPALVSALAWIVNQPSRALAWLWERWHCCIVVCICFVHQMPAMDSVRLFIRLRHFAFKCHILSSVFKGKCFGIERFYFREMLKKKIYVFTSKIKKSPQELHCSNAENRLFHSKIALT